MQEIGFCNFHIVTTVFLKEGVRFSIIAAAPGLDFINCLHPGLDFTLTLIFQKRRKCLYFLSCKICC